VPLSPEPALRPHEMGLVGAATDEGYQERQPAERRRAEREARLRDLKRRGLWEPHPDAPPVTAKDVTPSGEARQAAPGAGSPRIRRTPGRGGKSSLKGRCGRHLLTGLRIKGSPASSTSGRTKTSCRCPDRTGKAPGRLLPEWSRTMGPQPRGLLLGQRRAQLRSRSPGQW
jgi:hypothetical protein